MTKEELEKLKKELREEIITELEHTSQTQNKVSYWHIYQKEYIYPRLDKKFDSAKIKYKLNNVLNGIARIYNNKTNVRRLTEEEVEHTKPLINTILNEMGLPE